MSTTVKLNTAFWAGVTGAFLSLGAMLIGVGTVISNDTSQRRDIDKNSQSIDNLQSSVRSEINRLSSQMRENHQLTMEAIREQKD